MVCNRHFASEKWLSVQIRPISVIRGLCVLANRFIDHGRNGFDGFARISCRFDHYRIAGHKSLVLSNDL